MLAYIRFRAVSGFVAAAMLALAALLGFAAEWLANAQEPLRLAGPLPSSIETVAVGRARGSDLRPAKKSAGTVGEPFRPRAVSQATHYSYATPVTQYVMARGSSNTSVRG
jgi:hypothetical protein